MSVCLRPESIPPRVCLCLCVCACVSALPHLWSACIRLSTLSVCSPLTPHPPSPDEEDYGWKLIHGDVFRYPDHKMLLSALLGNGVQFLVLTMALLLMHVVGVFYPGSGNSLYTASLVLYALTAGTCIGR